MAEFPAPRPPRGNTGAPRARARRTAVVLVAATGLYGLLIASFGQFFFADTPSVPFWTGLALILGAGVAAAILLGAMRR